MLPKIPFGFFTLVRKKSHPAQAVFKGQPFYPSSGTHAKPAPIIIDEGGELALRPVGIRHIEPLSPSNHPITRIMSQQVSIAGSWKSRYSRRMLLWRHVRTILTSLLLMTAIAYLANLANHHWSSPHIWFSLSFFVALPAVLIGLLLFHQSWVLMAITMYGTIGLALDIATLVQEATLAEASTSILVMESLSGLLNFLLIVYGGRVFLSGTMAGRPVASRHPNPPSPFSS